jgi:hypothetical protein
MVKRKLQRADMVLASFGWLCLASFAAVVIIPGLSSRFVFLGTDLLTVSAPWSSSNLAEVTNRGISDTFDSATAALIALSDSIRSGSFALWDPYNSGGTILGALPNSGMLSPLSWPWLVLPHGMANATVKLVELVVIAVGFQLLLRKNWALPLCTVPVASLVFATSGFMVAWTNWPQTRVASLMPLLFWTLDSLAVRSNLRDVLFFAIVLASMVLGGFPAIVVYAAYLGAAFFFVRSASVRNSLRGILFRLGRVLAGALGAFLLSAVQILPFIWWSQNYVDFTARSALSGSPLPLSTLATAVVPSLLGNPDMHYGAWPIHFVEGFSYIGAAPIVLIAASFLLRPKHTLPKGIMPFFQVVFILLLFTLYFDTPLFRIVSGLPGISTSLIGRMRSVLGCVASILAAFGVALVFDGGSLRDEIAEVKKNHRRVFGSIVRILAVLLVALVICAATYSAFMRIPTSQSKHQMLLSLAVISLCLLLVMMVWISPKTGTRVISLLVIVSVTTISATTVAHRWWPLSESDTFYPETDVHKALIEELGSDRYATVGGAMAPGTSTVYKLRSLTGHGFTSPEWHSLMVTVDPEFFQTPTWSTLHKESLPSALTSPILDRLGVRYVACSVEDCVDDDDIAQAISESPSLSVEYFGDTVLIKRDSALGRIRWASSELVISDAEARIAAMNDPSTAGSAVILDNADSAQSLSGSSTASVLAQDINSDHISISVISDGPGWVVIADPMQDNGWTATLDGYATKLVDAEQTGVAVYIPSAGNHTIGLNYSTPYFRVGAYVSAISVIVLVLASLCVEIVRYRKMRKATRNVQPGG